MKLWLDNYIGNAIHAASVEHRSTIGPKLCCEVNEGDPDHIAARLADAIREWDSKLIVGFFRFGEVIRTCVFSMDDLMDVVLEAIETEEVISLMDLASVGGCVFDFSRDGDRTVEFLVSAWGSHESMSKDLSEQIPNSFLFRGN